MKRANITELFPDATDEQISAIMNLNGDDINNAKKGVTDLQAQLTAAQARVTELEGLIPSPEDQGRMQALQAELEALKAANALRDMRSKVAGEKSVPAELLTGETEDACSLQADAILAFANSYQIYPEIRDAGELSQIVHRQTTREQFADWIANHSSVWD